MTDVANETQRLTLDIVGLTAFSHDFKQVQVRVFLGFNDGWVQVFHRCLAFAWG